MHPFVSATNMEASYGRLLSFLAIMISFSGVFGDVPEDVVYTDLQKTVRLGGSVVLKCQFRGTPLAVYWKKGDDPQTAPNLVSWIPGDSVTGLCGGERPCQIMEMNENFSLIIKEVSIAEEGRYICRVASYKGILIHNFTEVHLFSPPQDPVPVIDQCASREPFAPQSCIISTGSPINITCSVSRYYPDVDLFFPHGLNTITDQVITERTNHDGTKNKSISIKGSSSDIPYVCVASDIPGSKDQRAATILIRLPIVPPSLSGVKRSSPIKIVVPVIIIALAGGTFLIVYCWLKRRKTTRKPEEENVPPMSKKEQGGKISFFQIWTLIGESSDMLKIRNMLTELVRKDLEEDLDQQAAYHYICKWKDENRTSDQANILKDAFRKADLEEAWDKAEKRMRIPTRLPDYVLEQILWDIRSYSKITMHYFLQKLIRRPDNTLDLTQPLKDIQEALVLMKNCNCGPLDENQISLALEEVKCSPLDRTFFTRKISFFQIWTLIDDESNDVLKIRNMLTELGVTDLEEDLDQQRAYKYLCAWKDQTRTSDQANILKHVFRRADLEEAWDKAEKRMRTPTRLPDYVLEQILRDIGSYSKIHVRDFLQKLIQRLENTLNLAQPLKDIIQEALVLMKNWNCRPLDENPNTLISLALEEAKCSPLDRTFFTALGNKCIVYRHQWGAREPKSPPKKMNTRVSYVILFHTMGAQCKTFDECCRVMRNLQNDHMDVQAWDDIGYSFVIGGDGHVYEGRGWNEGAHTKGYNDKSLGVAFMGNFHGKPPSNKTLDALKYLINYAVEEKVLTEDYILLGQRQVYPNREGPGDALYREIQSWPHWKTGTFFLS